MGFRRPSLALDAPNIAHRCCMIAADEYTQWLTRGDAEMHARIIDAHYAQAEKADEARLGAALVRWILVMQVQCDWNAYDGMTPADPLQWDRRWTAFRRYDRSRRDANDPNLNPYSRIGARLLLRMTTTPATQQTKENR